MSTLPVEPTQPTPQPNIEIQPSAYVPPWQPDQGQETVLSNHVNESSPIAKPASVVSGTPIKQPYPEARASMYMPPQQSDKDHVSQVCGFLAVVASFFAAILTIIAGCGLAVVWVVVVVVGVVVVGGVIGGVAYVFIKA